MTLNKKIIIGCAITIIVVIVVNFGLNFWIKQKLPKIIKKNNTSSYIVSYKNIEINIWSTSIFADSIVVVPKIKPQNSSKKIGIYATIKRIDLTHFSIWNLLIHNAITAQSITITEPKVVVYYKKGKDKNNLDRVKNDVVRPFEQIIKVGTLFLKKATLTLLNTKTNKMFFGAKNITMNIEGITVDKNTLNQKIPFKYSKYDLKIDSIVYQPSLFYKIKTSHLILTNNELKANDFELIPLLNRHQFVKAVKLEKDQFNVRAKELHITAMEWGFKKEQLFFNAQKILLDQVDATIYRNKIPNDDLSKKKLYSEVLRNLKFAMNIDEFEMRNSKLIYEEEVTFEKGPAILIFDKFNLNANTIQSGLNLKEAKDLTIKINCVFMKNSTLIVDWKFNVLDKTDSFTINGTIADFDLNAMKRFTKPFLNASFDGTFKKYEFAIWGNDFNSKGRASLYYKNLDVTFYQKKGSQKESKIKSTIANWVIKKDSDNKLKKCTMELERIQEKSFYNFLWRNVAESLKKILI